jgi:bla regulator protein blaR1
MPVCFTLLLFVAVGLPFAAPAQATLPQADTAAAPMPDWQKAAGGKMEFDVASVRLDTGDFKPPSIAMSNDNGMQPRDGLFHSGFPLSVDIEFAYKVSLAPEQEQAMLAPLPKWVKTDRYEIEARSPDKPTKDQVRLMMQSLLAERFGLKVRVETRTVPVFAMVLVKPGKLGPKLIPHAEGPPCVESVTPRTQEPGAKPVAQVLCGTYSLSRSADGTSLWESHKTTMALVASMLPTLGGLGKPVVDQTGLSGDYDVAVEFSMEATRAAARAASSANPDPQPEATGMTFMDAVQEQLGLKLESAKGSVQVLVVDHIERPTEN